MDQVDTVDDVIDCILMHEDGRELTPDELSDRFGGVYDLALIETALAEIKEQGL